MALIVRDGKILMGLREYEKGKPVWTFPGGRCEVNEETEAGLKREVEEEIGVTDLEIKRLLGEKKGVWTNQEGVTDQVFFYECATKQEPKLMEPQKFLEWRWIDLKTLPDNLIDVQDSKFVELIK